MGIQQAGFDDEIEAAYASAAYMIQRHAEANAWTESQLQSALDDVEAIYTSIGSWTGWATSFWDADVGESVGQDQIQDFWDQLSDVATTWDGNRVDQLIASFVSGEATVATVAENSVATPTDFAETYIVDPLVMTAQDVRETATDRRVWVAAGVAAALLLVVAIRR